MNSLSLITKVSVVVIPCVSFYGIHDDDDDDDDDNNNNNKNKKKKKKKNNFIRTRASYLTKS